MRLYQQYAPADMAAGCGVREGAGADGAQGRGALN